MDEELQHYLQYHENELLIIEKVQDMKLDKGEVKVLVNQKGFEEAENDWVSLESLQHDVPDLIKKYLESSEVDGTPRQKRVVKRF